MVTDMTMPLAINDKNSIASYSQDVLLDVLRNEIGLRFEIPDIMTFVHDDYYLGKYYWDKYKNRSRIYPFWQDILQDIFPNNLTTKTSYLTFGGCIGCITGDTKIDTLKGTKTFKEILDVWNSGNHDIYVMSANPEKLRIEYDKVIDVFISGNKKVYEITLDNSETFKCTSNHLFLTKDNKWASIDNGLLKEGLSLLPFNHKIENGYYEFYDPYKGVWKKRYRAVARQRDGDIKKGHQIHHKDFNKHNDNPDNLESLPLIDHFNLHAKAEGLDELSLEDFKKWRSNCGKIRANKLHYAPKYENVRKERKEKLRLNMKNGQSEMMLKKRLEKYNNDPEFRKRIHDKIAFNNANNHPKLRKDITFENIVKTALDSGYYQEAKLAELLNCSRTKIRTTTHMKTKKFCEYLGFYFRGRYGQLSKKPNINELLSSYKKFGKDDLKFYSNVYNCDLNYLENLIQKNKECWNERNFNHKVISIKECGYEDVYDLTTENNHNFALNCGIFAHNSGKSTVSSIVIMYDYIKMLAMIDPGSFFELINLNGIYIFGNSIYKYKAQDFINPIKKMIEGAPFYQDLKKTGNLNKNIRIAPSYGKKSIVSTDAAVIWLSEVNEYKNPKDLINASLSRMRGRFQKGMGIFTHFILDCSDTELGSATDWFINESAFAPEVASYKANIWSVKPHLYWHKDPISFDVYAGDSVISPHILKPGEDTSGYDKDRLLKVPYELFPQYDADINKALQETAGLSLVSGGLFFPDDTIKRHFSIPQITKDTMTFDFYDDTQIMDLDDVADAIDALLPDDRYIFIGVDCGYASDHYGLAIGYADSLSTTEMSDGQTKVSDYYIKIPFVVGFGRNKGQQTNISKVRNFILQINEKHPVYMVSYDGHQTVQLAQEMKMAGINTQYVSVEKDKYPLLFKHSLCEGHVELPDNMTLYREMRCLKHKGGYVDHSHVEASENGLTKASGINSKDMFDAVVRCFVITYKNLSKSLEVPKENSEYHQKVWENAISQTTRLRLEKQAMMQYMIASKSFNPQNIRGGF